MNMIVMHYAIETIRMAANQCEACELPVTAQKLRILANDAETEHLALRAKQEEARLIANGTEALPE